MSLGGQKPQRCSPRWLPTHWLSISAFKTPHVGPAQLHVKRAWILCSGLVKHHTDPKDSSRNPAGQTHKSVSFNKEGPAAIALLWPHPAPAGKQGRDRHKST